MQVDFSLGELSFQLDNTVRLFYHSLERYFIEDNLLG